MHYHIINCFIKPTLMMTRAVPLNYKDRGTDITEVSTITALSKVHFHRGKLPPKNLSVFTRLMKAEFHSKIIANTGIYFYWWQVTVEVVVSPYCDKHNKLPTVCVKRL